VIQVASLNILGGSGSMIWAPLDNIQSINQLLMSELPSPLPTFKGLTVIRESINIVSMTQPFDLSLFAHVYLGNVTYLTLWGLGISNLVSMPPLNANIADLTLKNLSVNSIGLLSSVVSVEFGLLQDLTLTDLNFPNLQSWTYLYMTDVYVNFFTTPLLQVACNLWIFTAVSGLQILEISTPGMTQLGIYGLPDLRSVTVNVATVVQNAYFSGCPQLASIYFLSVAQMNILSLINMPALSVLGLCNIGVRQVATSVITQAVPLLSCYGLTQLILKWQPPTQNVLGCNTTSSTVYCGGSGEGSGTASGGAIPFSSSSTSSTAPELIHIIPGFIDHDPFAGGRQFDSDSKPSKHWPLQIADESDGSDVLAAHLTGGYYVPDVLPPVPESAVTSTSSGKWTSVQTTTTSVNDPSSISWRWQQKHHSFQRSHVLTPSPINQSKD